ncbi:phage tail protein [Streptomyces sp. NPDC050844]|uniref:phage tail protein n=1 Tax=Streptomyces sp. NPDC050844 TaxID=3155790 RepID=UPI0033F0CBEA
MRGLRDGTNGANNSLRTLNTRATTAQGRLGDLSNSTRTLRSDTDDLDGSMRRLTGTLGGLRGSLGTIRVNAGGAGGSMSKLKSAALLLAPALIPIAAAALPLAASVGAAGVALAAFGLAAGGQVASLVKASEAEKKYTEAVKQHGPASQEAAKAQEAYLRQVREMDPATRRAAAAFGVFKDQYKAWSGSLAGDTMPVVTKSFAVFGGLLPRLTPLIRGTSSELDRLMTVLAGGVNSSGFDRLMDSFAEFASGTLSKATDGLVRFMRAMSGGGGSGQFAEFMSYVREVGPEVGETLSNLARALVHVVAAASETGVGLLSIVNAFAQLVNAVPTELLSTLLQVYTAFKLISLAGAGIGAASAGFTSLAARVAALRAASAAAGGGVLGLRAALASLSTGAKIGVAVAGVAALVLALRSLSNNKPAVEVDALSSSLNTLVSTGKVTGTLKTNLDEMSSSIAMVSKGASDNKLAQLTSDFGTWIGIANGPGISTAKENVDAWDKSMASLVKAGHPKQAAAQYELLKKAWLAGGGDTDRLKKTTNDYNDALANAKFEAKLAADAMGLFGAQAQSVQTKLDGQKQSADGLRQSIEALNDANRSALGGMIGFEASIDAAAKAAKENAGSLNMVNGRLDVNSPKAQAAATALNDLATKTKDAALAARESGDSWEHVNGIYERGRSAFIKSARAMGLNEKQARQLANTYMKIPSEKSMKLKMKKEDAERDLKAFNAAVKRTPFTKSVTLKTLSKGAEKLLEGFGYKVKRLPNGKVTVSARTGGALSGVRNVRAAVASLRSKTITITTAYRITGRPGGPPSGTYLGSTAGRSADGNIYSGAKAYADGGVESHVAQIAQPNLRVWAEPETGGEAYIPLAEGKRPRSLAILEDVAERFGYGLEKFARGGLSKAQKRAAAQRKSEGEARKEARGDLTISHFGRRAGYQNTEFRNALGKPDSIGSLTSALNQWRSTIQKSTHGGTERRLLRTLDSAGKSLIKYERQLTSVNKALESAKGKLSDLKNSFTQLRDSVKGNILSYANITKAAGGEGRVTTAGVMGGLKESRDKASSFAGALASLKKKGLSKDLLAQIAESGIEGGGLETAEALMRASKSEIADMNKLQGQIAKSAKAAGTTAADAMYGAGIKAAEGLVKGLQKKQDAIEKQMMRIAKSMEKAIKRALGIRSPSKVMEQIGDHTAQGFAQGIHRNRNVRPAWESMLNLPQGASAADRHTAVRTAAGQARDAWEGRPVVVPISLGGAQLGTVFVDVVRKEVRIRGGSVQAVLGQGAG